MKVAVAVIFDEKDRVLITRRALQNTHGGLWEFPGGKLEAFEEAKQALEREIREEVGIEIMDSQFLGEIDYQYPDFKVTLIVFTVKQFKGQATCRESQMGLRWVSLDELPDYHFPKANQEIIKLLSNEGKDPRNVALMETPS